MGAYMSKPVTEKHSEETENSRFQVGSSAMQGWRVSQEDAHNAILEYDADAAYFAVYDGHGGQEVAQYAANKLPNFILNHKNYGQEDLGKTLTDCFVSFDSTLIERPVVAQLKQIAGTAGDDEDDEDPNEVNHLYEEATMPIEQVISKYGEDGKVLKNPAVAKLGGEGGSGSKPISPFLRAKATNKHIRFGGSEGEVVKEEDKKSGGDVLVEEKKDPVKEEEEGEETKVVNGHSNGNGEDGEKPKNDDGDKKSDEISGTPPSVAGKGKGKGKGKSSQIKPKSTTEEEDEEDALVPTAAAQQIASPPKVKKTAEELYHSMLDEVAEEESEEEEEEEDFAHEESSDDDDDDEEEGEAAEDGDSDTEEEDEEEEDGEEFIGGEFNEEPGNDSGCTAVVAVIRGNQLTVANAGDSRCVVCRDGKAVEMSFDHKPEDELEMERIVKAGGKVTADGRVNGGLNLSRAIGDHAYKTNKSLPLTEQMISPVPDIKTLTIDPATDPFMVLACDGIWNSLSSQEVVDFISERLDAKNPPAKLTSICEELFDHCLSPDTSGDGTGCDNMTAVIVRFKSDHNKKRKDTEGEAERQPHKKAKVEGGGEAAPPKQEEETS